MTFPKPNKTSKSNKILIIYHANCPDGIGAAWCFHHFSSKLGWPVVSISYFPASYYQDPPDVSEYNDVYIVDFSYSKEITLNMASKISGKMVVLDHHKTAVENLDKVKAKNLTIILDINRSGAQIAWDYLADKQQRPWFIDYIGDRDLWQFKLYRSKEVNRALSIDGYLDINKLYNLLTIKPEVLAAAGSFYMKMEGILVNDIIGKAVKIPWTVSNKIFQVYVVESNVLISEVGDALVSKSDSDFVIIWRYQPNKKNFGYSLRSSVKSGIDVSLIAKVYGGGGHAQASGFSTDKFLFG